MANPLDATCAATCNLHVEEGMGRMSPVRLVPDGTHGMAVLLRRGPGLALQLCTRLRQAPRPEPCGLPLALSAPRHEDFPRSMSGASSLSVRCEAVLPLPTQAVSEHPKKYLNSNRTTAYCLSAPAAHRRKICAAASPTLQQPPGFKSRNYATFVNFPLEAWGE